MARLAESNGSLLPGLWLMSPAGWLPRTGIGRREANKWLTDSKHRATGDNYPAYNRPIVWRLLVSILGSPEIPFLGSKKRSRLSSLVNIPVCFNVIFLHIRATFRISYYIAYHLCHLFSGIILIVLMLLALCKCDKHGGQMQWHVS